jgi:hypothetical protein
MTEWDRRIIAALVVIVLFLTIAMFAAPAHARACYWSERFDKGCRNQTIYLVHHQKHPTPTVTVQIGKGKPCDARGDWCDDDHLPV